MNINIWWSFNKSENNLNLNDWDAFGNRELRDKDHYLYALSVVLSRAFQEEAKKEEAKKEEAKIYDYKLIYDLLSWEKTQSYTIETLDYFLSDLKNFTIYWADKNISPEDKNKKLIKIFEERLEEFSKEKHFDRLKTHWLKSRIHKPIFAVLKARAVKWKATAPNPHNINEELLDNLDQANLN